MAIIDGNSLSSLRQSTYANTVQPTSNPAGAKEAVEASQIQTIESPPVIVENDKAFDTYDNTFAQEDLEQEVKEHFNEQTTTMRESSEPVEMDYASLAVPTLQVDEGSSTEHSSYGAGRVITEESIAHQQTTISTTVRPDLVRTVAAVVAEKVDIANAAPTAEKRTDEAVLAHADANTADVMKVERESMEMDTTEPLAPDTQHDLHMAKPSYTQNVVELHETLESQDSPILRPPTEPMYERAEAPVVRESSQLEESMEPPVFHEESPIDVMAEEQFQEEAMDKVLVAAKEQSQEVSNPQGGLDAMAEFQAQTTAAPLVAQVEIEPQPVVEPQNDNAQIVPVAENNAVAVENQNQPSAESALANTGENNGANTQDEAQAPVRQELQSTSQLMAQEAVTAPITQESNYEIEIPEPREVELPENLQPLTVEANTTPEVTTDIPASTVAEAPSQIVEETETPALEDYFPPLPASDGASEEVAVQESQTPEVAEELPPLEDYFPPLPTGEATQAVEIPEQNYEPVTVDRSPTVSEEAIAENSEEVMESREYEVETTTISEEQLAYLRNAALFTPAVQEAQNPVMEEVVDEEVMEDVPVEEQDWYRNAVNYDTTERYAMEIGKGEVDLTEFEEGYTLEELSTLENYDYTLQVNRITEAVETQKSEEFTHYFGA